MQQFLRPSCYFKTRPPSCALGTSFYTMSEGRDLMMYVSDNYTSYSAPSPLSGFNKPELSKHRKRSILNMNREKLLEYATVLQEYATSSWIEQPQFTTFMPALQLIESLLSYASYAK